MIKTPKVLLGEGYPLPTDKARLETAPIWELAFEIHKTAHDFTREKILSESTISPIFESPSYCECYLKAWLQCLNPTFPKEVKIEYIETNPFEEREI